MNSRVLRTIVPALTFATFAAGCAGPASYELDPAMRSRVVKLEFVPEHEITVDGPCLIKTDEGFCLVDGDYEETVEDAWYMDAQQCEVAGPFTPAEGDDCDVVTYEIGQEIYDQLTRGDFVTTEREVVRIPK